VCEEQGHEQCGMGHVGDEPQPEGHEVGDGAGWSFPWIKQATVHAQTRLGDGGQRHVERGETTFRQRSVDGRKSPGEDVEGGGKRHEKVGPVDHLEKGQPGERRRHGFRPSHGHLVDRLAEQEMLHGFRDLDRPDARTEYCAIPAVEALFHARIALRGQWVSERGAPNDVEPGAVLGIGKRHRGHGIGEVATCDRPGSDHELVVAAVGEPGGVATPKGHLGVAAHWGLLRTSVVEEGPEMDHRKFAFVEQCLEDEAVQSRRLGGGSLFDAHQAVVGSGRRSRARETQRELDAFRGPLWNGFVAEHAFEECVQEGGFALEVGARQTRFGRLQESLDRADRRGDSSSPGAERAREGRRPGCSPEQQTFPGAAVGHLQACAAQAQGRSRLEDLEALQCPKPESHAVLGDLHDGGQDRRCPKSGGKVLEEPNGESEDGRGGELGGHGVSLSGSAASSHPSETTMPETTSLALPATDVQARWELASSEIATSLLRDLVLAFVGAASSGKDAAIRALFGVDFGQIDPIPGTTDRLRAVRLDLDGHVVLVNAPGFGDLRAEVDAVARRLVERMDLALFLVNADGGATADDRRNLDSVRALGRPVLVCVNKVDLIREHQRDDLVRTTLAQLGVNASDAVATAFDPLPMLASEPIGAAETIDWIMSTLAKEGKSLLFAKQLRAKAAACESIIRSYARKAAAAGAIPVVGADMVAVTALQVRLVGDIAAVYDARIDKDVALFIAGEALAGAGRGFVRWATEVLKTAGFIPGGQIGELAASALGAVVAGAATYGVGRAAIVYMEKLQKGASMSPEEVREAFDAGAFAWRDRENRGHPQQILADPETKDRTPSDPSGSSPKGEGG
jgi:uncharacterized protein (DUF697 family)/GTP-binding protein EngB required for normal cell division